MHMTYVDMYIGILKYETHNIISMKWLTLIMGIKLISSINMECTYLCNILACTVAIRYN